MKKRDEVRCRMPVWFKKYADHVKAMSEVQFSEILFGKDRDDSYFYTKQERDGEKIVSSYSRKLLTPQEQAEYHDIDLDKYEPSSITTNYYEQGAKIKVGDEYKVTTTGLHQLKVKWLPKVRSDYETIKGDLLNQIQARSKDRAAHKPRKQKYAVEIMVTDLHLGKVGFDEQNLTLNWSLEKCASVYHQVIHDAVDRIGPDNIDHFILPTGNDLLNVDSGNNATTKGTPQMTGEFWGTLFRYAKEMLVCSVDTLADIAPVHVYFVPGNHDNDSVFSLGEVVSAWYRNDGRVIIHNEANKRQYHEWGECAILYDHLDFKFSDAHKLFATSAPHLVAKKYKAVHGGHKHKSQRNTILDLTMRDEVNGIDVEICPALSPTDRWHWQNLYIGNLRRSKTFVWDKDNGCKQELYFNL
jgi:hypothetical protein